jgi:hypothetical protein
MRMLALRSRSRSRSRLPAARAGHPPTAGDEPAPAVEAWRGAGARVVVRVPGWVPAASRELVSGAAASAQAVRRWLGEAR